MPSRSLDRRTVETVTGNHAADQGTPVAAELCVYRCCNKRGAVERFLILATASIWYIAGYKTFPSACAVLDYFYAERDRYARVRQRANDLFHLLLHATERIQRRIAAQTEERTQCAEKDTFRRKADLLSANLTA